MPKFFPGITHAIVKTPTNARVMTKMNEAIAMVRLCFTGDEDFILVKISKMSGPTAGVTATIPSFPLTLDDGKTVPLPAIQGKVANEAKLEALIAFDKVKSKFGIKFNKQYRVLEKTVEEITNNG